VVVRRTHDLLHLLLWTSLPLQGLPPCRGGVQVLLLLLPPPPQVLEHWPQALHSDHTPSTGAWQAWVLHPSTPAASPSQGLPPCMGGVQVLLLLL